MYFHDSHAYSELWVDMLFCVLLVVGVCGLLEYDAVWTAVARLYGITAQKTEILFSFFFSGMHP
jgi:hypothetical protein